MKSQVKKPPLGDMILDSQPSRRLAAHPSYIYIIALDSKIIRKIVMASEYNQVSDSLKA